MAEPQRLTATPEDIVEQLRRDVEARGWRGVETGVSIEDALALAGAPLRDDTQDNQRVLTYEDALIDEPGWRGFTIKVIAYDGEKVSSTRVRIECPLHTDEAKAMVAKLRDHLRSVHGKPTVSRTGQWEWAKPGRAPGSSATAAWLKVSAHESAVILSLG